MKRTLIATLFAFAAFAVLVVLPMQTAQAGGEGWLTDWEAAVKKAKEEEKSILIDFTGSDW